MKHRFLFILPRLAILAVLIGTASLVLFLLFKLLLLVIAIGVIAAIAGKIISKARAKWMENAGLSTGREPYHRQLHGPATLQPVASNRRHAQPAIIPIN
ncbi:hypothetical protein [Niabella ginsenosidivorans]|uniref:hypothetical protein n=1 Tax=Niabella ginsenosidivorans TaxID=1176587 RepID=UPI0012ED426B|nr:hypothetical protein [Niabella ginsenosidivorans]